MSRKRSDRVFFFSGTCWNYRTSETQWCWKRKRRESIDNDLHYRRGSFFAVWASQSSAQNDRGWKWKPMRGSVFYKYPIKIGVIKRMLYTLESIRGIINVDGQLYGWLPTDERRKLAYLVWSFSRGLWQIATGESNGLHWSVVGGMFCLRFTCFE